MKNAERKVAQQYEAVRRANSIMAPRMPNLAQSPNEEVNPKRKENNDCGPASILFNVETLGGRPVASVGYPGVLGAMNEDRTCCITKIPMKGARG